MTRRSLRSERGQTMAEYTVVISIVTLIVLAAFAALSTGIAGQLTRVAGYVVS